MDGMNLDITAEEENTGDGEAHGATRAADFLRALANPHRLMILRLLQHSRHTVMELCDRLQLRQSLVSQHLARLRADGVVTAERQGHFVIYSLHEGKARNILDALADIIDLPGDRSASQGRGTNGDFALAPSNGSRPAP